MITIIDYGMGNLRSVQKALENVGAAARISQNKNDIANADKVVLPGVGALKPAMDKLSELDLLESVQAAAVSGKPFLGICLGYQLLFEQSDEGGSVNGLGILKGTVEHLEKGHALSNAGGGTSQDVCVRLKVPHMGWNQIQKKQPNNPLFKNIDDQANVYFCHSYAVYPTDPSIVAATTDYGINFASAVTSGNIYGVQFHPEKSQNIGLQILKNFVELD